jgi:hypothetical protein
MNRTRLVRLGAVLALGATLAVQPTSPNPDLSSGFLVFRSTQNDGASWNFPGRYVIVNADAEGEGDVLEDKQYMTVDPDTFLCPGSATPGHPPTLCGLTEPNGVVANDENIYVDTVNVPTR